MWTFIRCINHEIVFIVCLSSSPQTIAVYLRSETYMPLAVLILTHRLCLIVCFTSDHNIFAVHLKPDFMSLGVSIMTFNSRPLLQTTYEVILLHPTRIWQKVFNSLLESNQGPLDHESYALTVLALVKSELTAPLNLWLILMINT